VDGLATAYLATWCQHPGGLRASLDEATARFVAAIDASIARGELETSSADLANLLGHAASRPAEVVHTAYDLLKGRSKHI
jgi:hypothetical protein